MGEKGTP